MTRVSIALCTYNGERYLDDQLQSILEQTRKPDELVICDDGSTDGTAEVVRRFIERVPFKVVFLINESNLGSTKNFEKAITQCTGDIIFLADQDDVWLPQKIELTESEFNADENVGLVFSDAELVDGDLRSLNERMWDYSFPLNRRKKAERSAFYRTLLQANTVTGATAAFRSKFVQEFVPIPDDVPLLIHDGWLALVISFMSEVVFINKPLIQYRQHTMQQIGVNRSDRQAGITPERLEAGLIESRQHWTVLDEISKRVHLVPHFVNSREIEEAIGKNLSFAAGRVIHLENRSKILNGEGRRIPIIMRELWTGRYSLYSNGWFSAIKDLILF